MKAFEKLGAFYLGRRFDADAQQVVEEDVLYDAKDLTTHAVCLGMTGSGKTGLGVVLLEEAAIDGIPVIAIDPKGDLGNLMLSFPRLAPEDFLPWVDPAEAARKGRTPEEHAGALADLWRGGLARWGQDPARIQRFADAVERTIYTPGSRSGIPIAILSSFEAPGEAVREDDELLRERVQSATSGLLALLGVEADPLRSRPHILISTILHRAWAQGESVDLPTLIRRVQDPPFQKIGVFELEAFFPADDRFELAMSINNLLASPGFEVWTEGQPLDVGKLLYTDAGRPRMSILSIAHLSDEERMFFVTMLLNEILAWTRSQPGTSSLRALVYMDEVFGYMPPTANPPSKKPLLTLLKQARAFGVGVVLASQNPVDLDYKGLSNAGTWFLGRLQTERDKARVLDGLEGIGGDFDRAETENMLSALDSRVFLMRNVHDDGPTLMHVRWALSYLGGPLTRTQIQSLMSDARSGESAPGATVAAPARRETVPAPSGTENQRPHLPPDIDEAFAACVAPVPVTQRLVYRPALYAEATLHYVLARADLDQWVQRIVVRRFDGEIDTKFFEDAQLLGPEALTLGAQPEAGAEFTPPPSEAQDAARYRKWAKMLRSHLYAHDRQPVYSCKLLELTSTPGETRAAFEIRVAEAMRERRDLEVEKLRARYAPKLQRLAERITAAEGRVEREEEQKRQHGLSTAVNIGATVLGAMFGRKLSSRNIGRASSAIRGAGRVRKEEGDIERARERVADLEAKLAALDAEFEEKVRALQQKFSGESAIIDEKAVAPRKADLGVERIALLWLPYRVDEAGIAEPAF